MVNEADRLMAIKAFKRREEQRKINRKLVIFLTALAIAELFAVFIFLMY